MCVCTLTLCAVISVVGAILQSYKKLKTEKELYDKGYEDAKKLYFDIWRKEFETARLKLIDHDNEWGDHYVTMYFKRKEL